MNNLKLELVKFIRSRMIIVVFSIFALLFGSLFYKNFIDYQGVNADKKHELLKIKGKIQDIIYPPYEQNPKSRYINDDKKMEILFQSLEVAENALNSKYRDDDKTFMEKAIKMYDGVINLKVNDIEFSFQKPYVEHEKNRLIEILKINGNFQYEETPLDGMLLFNKNIKYAMFITLIVTVGYFFTTAYIDMKKHKGFLFTLPMDKKSYITGKGLISILLNITLIAIQFIVCYLFATIWKWKNNLKYPVYSTRLNKFVPVKTELLWNIGVEIIICIVVLTVSVISINIYLKSKEKNLGGK